MYCTKCGKEVERGQKFCSNCGEPLIPEKRFCPNCGQELDFTMINCPHCGYHTPPIQPKKMNPKSKLVAGILGILVGGLGIHNFYLGNTSKGVIQIALTLCGIFTFGITSAISEIWGLVEGVLILIGNMSEDADGNPLE